MQQGPEKAQLAARLDLLEGRTLESRDEKIARRLDSGLAGERAVADEAHLAEELAGVDHVQQAAALRDFRFALGEEIEPVALLAFADDHLVGGRAAPLAGLGERPQFGLGER